VGTHAADLPAYAYLGLMVLIGSSTAPAAKFAVRELPAGLLPLIRFGVAGLCLLPVVLRHGGFARMVRDDGRRLAAAAALCVPVNQTFFLNGARLAPTSHVAMIYAACPLVVLLLAWALGQERFAPSRLVGVVVSVLGVVVIGLDSLWRGGTAGRATLQGDLLLVGAVVSWGAYLTAPLASASAAAWLGLAYLTLFVTVFGLAFQNLAMKRLDASQVATFGNAAPVLTVLWGVWLFGETVSPALALGGALTLGGILRTSRPARESAPDGFASSPLTPAPVPHL